jgi:signal transduction histidine kinase/ligand-binding sensor domain-containing protein
MILTLNVNGRSIHLAHMVRLIAQHTVALPIALLLLCGDLSALDPSHTIAQYGHVAWTRQNGGPQSGVFALAQTSDGDLWVGTEFGLSHFDGARFLPWLPPKGPRLSDETILSLAASADGSLWIGTHQGLTHWDGDRVSYYQTSTGPSGPSVAAIFVERNGTVWTGTVGYRSGGLCRVERDLLRCNDSVDSLSRPATTALYEDQSGNLWAGGPVGLSRVEPTNGRIHAVGQSIGNIHAIAEDNNGQIWIASGGGLGRLLDNKLAPFPLGSAERKIYPVALLSDRDGGLWIGTAGQGLMHLYNGRLDRFGQAEGLSSDHVRCLFEDREGNVWAATESGLDRFRDLPVTTISKGQGMPQSPVNVVFASQNGGIFVGGLGGLSRLEGGRVTVYRKRDGLPDDEIDAIFEQQSGRLWVDGRIGLAYSEGGRFHASDDSFGRKIHMMMAAAEDREHHVWLSDQEIGLLRIDETRVAEVVPWSQFENKEAWSLEADPKRGGLWLGFRQGGIARFKPGERILGYTKADGLAPGAVLDLHLALDGTLWIATEGGLSRLRDGHIATITTANGLPCNRIHAMVEDNSGALWLNTACGLLRLAGADLASWSAHPHAKVPVTAFDAGDGMRLHPTAAGYFRRAAKSNDGRLWFNVPDGIAVVDPGRLPRNSIPPPVKIEGIVADHAAFAPGSNVKLPALTRDLQIDYTAFSFVAPEKVRFRYKLEGFDPDWKDVGGRRQALYTNLPPDKYRFRVMACNNDGVWNTAGASFGFWIQPAFYQTLWFKVGCIASIAVLLWMFYRLRVRQIAARLRVGYEARLGERARISRELHDNLLQNITGFALQLDGLGKIVTAPESAKDRLQDLRGQAEQWMHDAREAVWDLRSAPDLEEHDLPDAVLEAVRQATRGKEVQYNLTVAGKRRAAPPKVQEQLLRIAQEATRNAVRHGQAKEITTHIAYMDADRIRVSICDDGCGFNLEEASRKTGHCGLASMRERAEQIGGNLRISTAPGQGTEIEIIAPISTQPL